MLSSIVRFDRTHPVQLTASILALPLRMSPGKKRQNRRHGLQRPRQLMETRELVKIGQAARGAKKIDYAGSRLTVRRGAIVCVADSRSYALLEIDRQLKIPLMSISSLDEAQSGAIVGQAQDISGSSGGGLLRSNSSAYSRAQIESPEPQTHRRGTSLGNLISSVNRKQEQHAVDTEELGSRSSTPPVSSCCSGTCGASSARWSRSSPPF